MILCSCRWILLGCIDDIVNACRSTGATHYKGVNRGRGLVGFVDISAQTNEESRCLNLFEIIKIYWRHLQCEILHEIKKNRLGTFAWWWSHIPNKKKVDYGSDFVRWQSIIKSVSICWLLNRAIMIEECIDTLLVCFWEVGNCCSSWDSPCNVFACWRSIGDWQ